MANTVIQGPPHDPLDVFRTQVPPTWERHGEYNDIVYEVLGHRTDLRTLVPAGMAVLAAYSWVKSPEARLPRWDNLVYWSYNIFSHLHRREIDERIGLASQPGGPEAVADTVGPSEP